MKVAVFFLCFGFVFASDLHIIGNKCKVPNGLSGICTLSKKCPTFEKEWKQGIMPKICGFVGSEPIVCCSLYPNMNLPKAEKSKMKCDEYAAELPEIRRRDTRNVYGGYRVKPQQFPHMAALGYLHSMTVVFKCGGSLISERFVLTAAHCLHIRQYGNVQYVRLGDLDLDHDDDDSSPKTYTIDYPLSHPGYHPTMTYNDIALLKLSESVKFSRHVHPACLYTQPDFPGDTLTALGWGPNMKTDDKSNSLMAVDLDVFPDGRCSGVYIAQRKLNRGIETVSQFCAGGLREDKDTCPGDSGGPLVHATEHNGLYYVVGVTSFGMKQTPKRMQLCGEKGQPGVYTRVSHYIPWIESVVWPDKHF